MTRDLNTEALRRVVVVGTSGAGKSTFARRLAGLLDCPHVELDALYWTPNWIGRPVEEFRAGVEQATSAECWVTDGNYSKVRDLVWSRATAAVWLNYGFPTVFSRAFRRTVQRIVSQEEIHNGNRETFRGGFLSIDGIPIWVLRTFRRVRREYASRFADPAYAHLQVFEFARPRAAEEFLLQLETSSAVDARCRVGET